MKRMLLLAALLGVSTLAHGQEKVGRDEALKYAFLLSANLNVLLDTPIPTDPDVKRPVAVRDEDHGALVLPETKLTAQTLAKAGKEIVPVGQLWLANLAPVSEGQVVPADKLRLVHLNDGNTELDAPCLALGVRKGSTNGLELLIYSKGHEPLMRLPLKATSVSQEMPIEMSAERKSDGSGTLTLQFFGKYEATLNLRPTAP